MRSIVRFALSLDIVLPLMRCVVAGKIVVPLPSVTAAAHLSGLAELDLPRAAYANDRALQQLSALTSLRRM